MATVTDIVVQKQGQPVFACDFSPSRGADLSTIAQVQQIGADLVCVAYSPGKSVRVTPIVMAHLLARGGSQQVIFNLAVRDMNRLAIQSYLLGAQLLGLQNVLVLQGDEMTERDHAQFKEVNDYAPSELLRDIKGLNQGVDFRGLKLREPTAFCAGAVIDFNKGIESEARRAHAKVEAGAEFFLAQTFHDIALAGAFHEAYRRVASVDLTAPVFYGLPVLAKDGIVFSSVPEQVRRDLEAGRSGVEVALAQGRRCLEYGLRTIYIVPPVLRGGRRDYAAAAQVVRGLRGG